jgi:hypothetical protein
MQDLFEKYLIRFPFDGKQFHFDWFLKIDKNLNFKYFEEMVDWVENNSILVFSILDKHKDVIDKNNQSYKKECSEMIKSREYALPTYENVTKYISMFDES